MNLAELEFNEPADQCLLENAALPAFELPAPREPGREGRRATVVSNAVKIDTQPGLVISQFDVSFWFERSAGEISEKKKKAAVPEGIAEILQSKLRSLFGHGKFGYDFSKIVYGLSDAAHLGSGVMPSGWSVGEEGGKKTFTTTLGADTAWATLRQVGEPLRMDSLVHGQVAGPVFRKYVAAIDVALGERHVYRCIKGAYYDENQRAAWSAIKRVGRDDLYQIWLGYRQTVIDTSQGLMLFVDTAATAMHAPLKILDFISNRKRPQCSPSNLTFDMVKAVEKNLCQHGVGKPKMSSSHQPKKTYKFFGLDDVPLRDAVYYDADTQAEKKVVDWWATNYPRVQLHRLDLPCACFSPKAKATSPAHVKRLPLELCSWAGGEPVQGGPPELTQEVIKEACQPPAERFNKISAIMGSKEHSMEMGVSPNLVTAEARVLESMELVYFNNQTRSSQTVRPDGSGKGGWNLNQGGRDLGFMRAGAQREPGVEHHVRSWLVINFEPRNMSERNVNDFLRKFTDLAGQRGIILPKNACNVEYDGTRYVNLSKPDEERLFAYLNGQSPLELVLCFLPESQGANNKFLYPALKRWSETQTGVPLACINTGKLLKERNGRNNLTDPSFHAGVLLKLNLKLGGTNVHPGRGGLALMLECPTMVCGVDVNHAAPGSDKDSWAALVASLDQYCSEFFTTVTSQPKSRTEVLSNLEENIITCVQKFTEKAGIPPRRIIFYRDGVAHNQFELVAQQEIGHILSALQKLGHGSTELIFIVVQKKTNARFGLEGGHMPGGKGKGKGKGKGGYDGKGGGGGGRGNFGNLGNVRPGTVIDTTITDRHGFDFYMVSQFGLQGTCRPSHYHVLYCPPSLTQDEIQRFTFDLCHVYARCTKIASRPAPIYYAHLAAMHASWYKANYLEKSYDFDDAMSTSSRGSGGSGASKASSYAPIIDSQRTRLYYA